MSILFACSPQFSHTKRTHKPQRDLWTRHPQLPTAFLEYAPLLRQRVTSFSSHSVAVRHPDGSVQIQDRTKDIIISGGEVCRVCTVSASCRRSLLRSYWCVPYITSVRFFASVINLHTHCHLACQRFSGAGLA